MQAIIVRVSVLFYLLCATAFAANNWQRVRIQHQFLTPELKRQLNFVHDHERDESYAYGYVQAVHFQQLGFTAHALFELAPEEHTLKNDLKNGYHDYPALTAFVKEIARENPSLVELATAGKSVEGRELWYLRVSNKQSFVSYKPKLLYIANIHGDEVVGREMMLQLAQYLTEEYADNLDVQALLDNFEVFLMPSMNPDGFERGQRWNRNNIDLNRDFPDHIKDPVDTTAGRQPETIAVMNFLKQFHFVSSMNFHGGELCVNLPWDGRSNRNESSRFGDNALIYHLGRQYTLLNQPMYDNHYRSFDHGLTFGYEWYAVYGGLQDYMNVYASSVHATLEISGRKWPRANRLPQFWEDNRDAMMTFLYQSQMGYAFELVNEAGEAITSSTFEVDSAPNRPLDYTRSEVFRPTIAGEHRVTIKAAGYKPKSLQLSARIFDGTYQKLVLEKEE